MQEAKWLADDAEIDLALLGLASPLRADKLPELRYAERRGFTTERSRWRVRGVPRSAFTKPIGHSSLEEAVQQTRIAVRAQEGKTAVAIGRHRYQISVDSAPFFERGFSGAGVQDQTNALVGILTARDSPAQDQSQSKVAFFISMDGIVETFPELRSSVGWRFETDQHLRVAWRWEDDDLARPRLGSYFTGRRVALDRLKEILDERDGRKPGLTLVTGSAGAGKSALLREVVRRGGSSIDFALHLRGYSPVDFVSQLAGAFSLADVQATNTDQSLSSQGAQEQLVRKIGQLAGRERISPLIVADSLDEAREHRVKIARLLGILGTSCSVVVAMRTGHEDQLSDPLRASEVMDLDTEDYFQPEDLRQFVRRLLQAECPKLPSTRVDASTRGISAAAGHNFLIAGLLTLARAQAFRSEQSWDDHALPDNVAEAMRLFIQRLPNSKRAWDLLLPPALGLGEGWPLRLWDAAVAELTGGPCTPEEIHRFKDSAVEYLIEEASSPKERSVRLFHDALAMTVIDERLDRARLWQRDAEVAQQLDQGLLTKVLLRHVEESGWERATPYVHSYLPQHAAAADRLHELVDDLGFLCHVDPSRLQLAAASVPGLSSAPPVKAHAFTLHLLSEDAAKNIALLRMAALYLGEEPLAEALGQSPWSGAPGASWFGQVQRVSPPSTSGHLDWVTAVSVVGEGPDLLLATASADRTVKLWKPYEASILEPEATLRGHTDTVRDVAAVDWPTPQGGPGLGFVTASDDMTVKLWRAGADGYEEEASFSGHSDWVRTAKAFRSRHGLRIVSAGDDGTLRIWDPSLERPEVRVLRGHDGWVLALCVLYEEDRPYILSGGGDGRIFVWDPERDSEEALFAVGHHQDVIRAITAFERADGWRIASVGDDRRLLVWPFRSPDKLKAVGDYRRSIRGVTAFRDSEQWQLMTGSSDHSIRLHRLDEEDREISSQQLKGHNDWVRGVAVIQGGAEKPVLLASGSDDGTARLWRYGRESSEMLQTFEENKSWLRTVCSVGAPDHPRVAAAGAGGQIHFWDLLDAQTPYRSLPGHQAWVRALLHIPAEGDEPSLSQSAGLILSAGDDGTIRRWRQVGGEAAGEVLFQGEAPIRGLTQFEHRQRHYVAGASDDGSLVVFALDDPVGSRRVLTGSGDWLRCVCPLRIGSEQFLAAGGDDLRVLIWNLDHPSAEPVAAAPGHSNSIRALCVAKVGSRFAPEQRLISTSDDGTLRAWRWQPRKRQPQSGTLESVQVTQGHKGSGLALCVQPDVQASGTGERIISVSADQYVKIWSAGDLRVVAEIPTLSPNYAATMLSPKDLVLVNQRGLLRIRLAS